MWSFQLTIINTKFLRSYRRQRDKIRERFEDKCKSFLGIRLGKKTEEPVYTQGAETVFIDTEIIKFIRCISGRAGSNEHKGTSIS